MAPGGHWGELLEISFAPKPPNPPLLVILGLEAVPFAAPGRPPATGELRGPPPASCERVVGGPVRAALPLGLRLWTELGTELGASPPQGLCWRRLSLMVLSLDSSQVAEDPGNDGVNALPSCFQGQKAGAGRSRSLGSACRKEEALAVLEVGRGGGRGRSRSWDSSRLHPKREHGAWPGPAAGSASRAGARGLP